MIYYREAFYAFRATMPDKPPWAWWRIFTHRGRFDHVSVFYFDHEFGHWILTEWSEFGMFTGIIADVELDAYVVYLLTGGGRILRYKAKDRRRPRLFPPIAWSYCISGAKHFANLFSFAMTPDQLERALRRDGANDAFTSVLGKDDADGISSAEPAVRP